MGLRPFVGYDCQATEAEISDDASDGPGEKQARFVFLNRKRMDV